MPNLRNPQNDEILPLLDEGYTFGQIAGILKITRSQVAGVAFRNGYCTPTPALQGNKARALPSKDKPVFDRTRMARA